MRTLDGRFTPPPYGEAPGPHSTAGGDPQGGGRLRDWQKNTWYGAAPVNGNPFDEPEDAPELREQRSESLNNHEGEFWSQQTSGYQFSGSVPAQGATAGHPQDRTAGRTRRTDGGKRKTASFRQPLTVALAMLAFAAAVWAVLYYAVFTVREIQVIGNSRVAAEEVIRLSGIRQGMPLLAVDSGQVEKGLSNNAYLRFRYIEREFPGTVRITVREREACCWMTWCGIFYTMDKQRVVLFETEEQNVRPADLVRVDGLRIRAGNTVGQTLMLETTEQQELFSNLFLEMKVLNCTEIVEEADLGNPYSILLTTRDGFTISMGDASNIHAKLRSMLLTRNELIRRGYKGGVINVINPESPIYSPEQQTGV